MIGIIPNHLYRGDADPAKKRRLKESWGSHGYLFTNMANGGDPLAIFNTPLIKSIQQHVAFGWDKSHFLSFSESRAIAEKYAGGAPTRSLEISDGKSWDALVLTIDTSQFVDVIRVEPGIYAASFAGKSVVGDTNDVGYMLMRYWANNDTQGSIVRILLVNLVEQIAAHREKEPSLEIAYKNAKRDREWLILPIDKPLGDGNMGIGFPGCIDDACISECKKYRVF
jgi:hypothetical protein